MPLQVTIGENMKKLLSAICKYLNNTWKTICLSGPPILYTLFFSLLPIIAVIIVAILHGKGWQLCCQENIKNGELFIVAMSFIASSWFIVTDSYKNPKVTWTTMRFTTLIAILVIAVSILYVVIQRTYNDFSDLRTISWVSGVNLFLSCIVYAQSISFKENLKDNHTQTEDDMVNRVTLRIREGR